MTLKTLHLLDYGKAAEALQTHLRRAAVDCLDRPGDAKARKVTLQFEIVPVLEPDGDCTEVRVTIQAISKMPTHCTKPYSMALRKNGSLGFSEDSPENVGQTTIFDGEIADDE